MSGFLDDIPGIPLGTKHKKRDIKQIKCVTYTIPRCPACGSSRCPTYESQGALKYRKCVDCSNTFKSFVLNWDPERDPDIKKTDTNS